MGRGPHVADVDPSSDTNARCPLIPVPGPCLGSQRNLPANFPARVDCGLEWTTRPASRVISAHTREVRGRPRGVSRKWPAESCDRANRLGRHKTSPVSMITSMTGKPEPVTAADRRSFDLVTRWLVLSLPAAFLARHRRGPGQRRPQQRLGRAVRPDPPRRATGTLGRHHRPAGRRSGGGPDRRLCRAGSAGGPATGSRIDDGNFAAATAIIGGHIVVHGARSILLRRRMPGLRVGLAVTLPYSVLLRRLRRRGYLQAGQTARSAAFGAMAAVPTLVTLRLLVRRLF